MLYVPEKSRLKTDIHKYQFLQGIDYAAPVSWRHERARKAHTIAAETTYQTSNSHQSNNELMKKE